MFRHLKRRARPKVSPALVLGAALLVGFAGASALASTSGGTITACVHHNGGGLYSARHCARHDRHLTWNAAGSSGPAGGALAGNYPNPTLADGSISDGSFALSALSVPVAGGVVSVSGTTPTLNTSFDRLGGTVTVTRTGTGIYDIAISDVDFFWLQQVTEITPLDTGLGFSARVDSNAGHLVVAMYDKTGLPADSGFSFVVFP